MSRVLFVLLMLWKTRLSKPMSEINARNANITLLLDSLLDGYDRQLRPGYGSDPVEVSVNILIRSMGPISEEQMMFSMDCYFRQTWIDPRLAFSPPEREDGNVTLLRPSIKMMEMLWKPDTVVLNGQNSYLHKITFENKFFRIQHTGSIYYSQRLTIKSSCPMHLQKYPLDNQTCPLYIGSFGYDENEVLVKWETKPNSSAVRKHKDITMAQFSLAGIQFDYKAPPPGHGLNRTLPVLYVEVALKREIGFYLLQIYLPCYLIVIISWVSFWINKEAVPARVFLGITTLLTTCTIAITGREGIPKVSYATALDVFLLMNFSFVFAALVEYAGVNYFTNEMQREGGPGGETEDEVKSPEPNKFLSFPSPTTEDMASPDPSVQPESCWLMFLHCLKGSAKYRTLYDNNKLNRFHISKIDSMARVFFPYCFICMNILYWAGFLYYF